MRKEKTIKIDEREIVVHELTVKEIGELMNPDENQKISTIDMLFGQEVTATAIAKATGLEIEDMEENFSPSDIKLIVDTMKELNAFFFDMTARLVGAASALPLKQ